jgi:hypothetical protein
VLSIPVPDRFRPALEAIERLGEDDAYRAAFLFGSIVRGETTRFSDVDVQVVARDENPCRNINHPVVNGVKLDLTFKSFAQVRAATEQEVARGERVPMLAESAIVFDKDGQLTALRAEVAATRPRPVDPREHQLMQFMLFHADDKVRRHIDADPASALLVMQTTLADVLKMHYRLHQRWWTSNKRLLHDLRAWDAPMADLVERFVTASAPTAKFVAWSAILDHTAASMGGRQPIAENNCACPRCAADLGAFARAASGSNRA